MPEPLLSQGSLGVNGEKDTLRAAQPCDLSSDLDVSGRNVRNSHHDLVDSDESGESREQHIGFHAPEEHSGILGQPRNLGSTQMARTTGGRIQQASHGDEGLPRGQSVAGEVPLPGQAALQPPSDEHGLAGGMPVGDAAAIVSHHVEESY